MKKSFDLLTSSGEELIKLMGAGGFAQVVWKRQPWKPFKLAWALEIGPPGTGNNLTTSDLNYNPGYITRNFVLEDKALDLIPSIDFKENATLGGVKKQNIHGGNVYSGFSILTSGANSSLLQKLADFEEKSSKQPALIEHPLYTKLGEYIKQREDKGFRDYQVENYIREYLPPDFPKYSRYSKKEKLDWFKNVDNLKEIKQWFLTSGRAKIRSMTRVLVEAQKALEGLVCLSQSMGGFNEALLMQKQTLQLKVEEPIGFDHYKTFTSQVKAHVRDRNKTAPLPLNDFTPVRTGFMRLLNLELIDTFGRIRKVEWDRTFAPSALKGEGGYPFYLPPRLVQPARIDFKFLPAHREVWRPKGDEYSAAYDIGSNPICGWIISDNVNGSLFIYDNEGIMLGSININSEWDVVPGFANTPDESTVVTGAQVPNLHLRKVVNYLLATGNKKSGTESPSFQEHFRRVLDNGLENINPEGYKNNRALALLTGRPIAVIRAQFNLELKDQPALNQDWQIFEHTIENHIPFEKRDQDKFTEVKFPIRVGNYQKLNDGVIGYWKEVEKGQSPGGYAYENDLFYAPQSDCVESAYIETQFQDEYNLDFQKEEAPMNFYHSISDSPRLFTMLMDPTCSVTITSGIVPVKQIKIPGEFYENVLDKIQAVFLTSPVITEKGRFRLPLPPIPGARWRWMERQKQNRWFVVDQTPLITKEIFLDHCPLEGKEALWNELLNRGWVRPVENSDDSFTVEILCEKKNTSLEDLNEVFREAQDEILSFLMQVSLYLQDPLERDLIRTGEIKEGWLMVDR